MATLPICFFFRSSSSRLADKKKGRKSIFLSPAASRLEQTCLILFKAPISEPCLLCNGFAAVNLTKLA